MGSHEAPVPTDDGGYVPLTPEEKQQAADAAMHALTVENDTAKAQRIADLATAADAKSEDKK